MMHSNTTESEQNIQHPHDVRGLLRYHEITMVMVAERAGCNILTATRVLDSCAALRSTMANSISTRDAVTQLLSEAGCPVDLADSWDALDAAIKNHWAAAA